MSTPIVRNSFGQTGPGQKPPATAYVHQKYPGVRHHPSGAQRIVRSDAEVAALGEEWSDRPCNPPQPAAVPPAGVGCAACAQLTKEKADMQTRFDGAWALKSAELEQAQAAHDALQAEASKTAQAIAEGNAQIDTLKKQNEALTTELEKKSAKK